MPTTVNPVTQPNELLRKVEELSGQNLFACYQCGTCAAGCPFGAAMDLLPDVLIRRLVFGLPGPLESEAIWLCTSCELCSERCPRGIDVARVFEALRQVRLRQGGEQLDVTRLPGTALRELPPIALVASLRKQTG